MVRFGPSADEPGERDRPEAFGCKRWEQATERRVRSAGAQSLAITRQIRPGRFSTAADAIDSDGHQIEFVPERARGADEAPVIAMAAYPTTQNHSTDMPDGKSD